MEIQLTKQAVTFLQSLLLGGLFGLLYDFFRVTRIAFVLSAWLVALEDVLFFLLAGAILFFYLLESNSGQIRYFILVGAALGWIIYFFSVGKAVIYVAFQVIAFLKKMLHILLRPFCILGRYLMGKYKQVHKKLLIFSGRVKFGLKSVPDLVYNVKDKMAERGRRMGKEKVQTKALMSDRLLKLAIFVLFAVLMIYFVKTKMEIARMQEQVAEVQQQVEINRLKVRDTELFLREDAQYMERVAREKLDYAHPEEKVFIDVTGSK